MLRRLRSRTGGNHRREATIAELRQRQIIGILTTTGTATWDDRLNRSMMLPTGVHLWTIDNQAANTADGQVRLQLRAILLNEPAATASGNLPMPSDGSLILLTDDNDIHSWNLTDLFQRADNGDEQAAEDLYELELHVQQRAMQAAITGYEVPESMRWPDDGSK